MQEECHPECNAAKRNEIEGSVVKTLQIPRLQFTLIRHLPAGRQGRRRNPSPINIIFRHRKTKCLPSPLPLSILLLSFATAKDNNKYVRLRKAYISTQGLLPKFNMYAFARRTFQSRSPLPNYRHRKSILLDRMRKQKPQRTFRLAGAFMYLSYIFAQIPRSGSSGTSIIASIAW